MDRRTFFVSTGIVYVGSVIGVLCTIGFYSASLRIGQQAFGALQATMSFMFLLASMRSCVSSFVVIQTGGERRALPTVVRGNIHFFVLIALAFATAFIAAAPLLRQFLRIDSTMVFVLIGLSFLPGAFSALMESILNVQQRFLALTVSMSIVPVASLALAIVFFYDGYHSVDPGWIVLLSQSSSCVVAFLVDWSFLKKRSSQRRRSSALWDQLRMVRPLFVASLLFGLSNRLDMLWARHALSALDAGSYAMCASVATVAYLVSSNIGRVASVSLRQEPTLKLVAVSYVIIIATASTLAVTFAIIGPLALRLIAGHDVAVDWNVLLPLFGMATLFSIILLDFSCLNVSTKRVHASLALMLVSTQAVSAWLFGTSGPAIAWTQLAALSVVTIVFTVTLVHSMRNLQNAPPHPAECHLVQST